MRTRVHASDTGKLSHEDLATCEISAPETGTGTAAPLAAAQALAALWIRWYSTPRVRDVPRIIDQFCHRAFPAVGVGGTAR